MIREFRIYKPNKQQSGAATKFQCVYKKRPGQDYPEQMLFLEMAPQTGDDSNGNAKFDWKAPDKQQTQSVLMKLGINDIGEILAVLTNKKPFVGMPAKDFKESKGLFHKHNNGNAVLKFGKVGTSYQLATSGKNNNNLCRVWHYVSEGEASVLEQLLRDFVSLYYNWGSIEPQTTQAS